jgi:hypoxanthine phosphoribosyltransferase
MMDVEEVKAVWEDADCLCTEAQVESAIKAVAVKITADLENDNPIVMSVMNGGLVFGGKLLTELRFPLQVDYIHATRYRNTTEGSKIEWKVPPQMNIQGRTVLVVDDIFDEGETLAAIVKDCQTQGAKQVLSTVLCTKVRERTVKDYTPDYIGLEIEDRYVFGYGMDYQSYLRNAPGIYAVKGY